MTSGHKMELLQGEGKIMRINLMKRSTLKSWQSKGDRLGEFAPKSKIFDKAMISFNLNVKFLTGRVRMIVP